MQACLFASFRTGSIVLPLRLRDFGTFYNLVMVFVLSLRPVFIFAESFKGCSEYGSSQRFVLTKLCSFFPFLKKHREASEEREG